MACKKYTLSNTGTTVEFFTYRRCDDGQTISQVSLKPGQRKNIWLLDNSYAVAGSMPDPVIISQVFPITPSNTRTPTPTQTNTPTNTPTKTSTQTPTQTPTNTTTPSQTPSQTATQTQTPSQTATRTMTPTQTASQTATPSQTTTQTQTPSQTTTQTQTPTPSLTVGLTQTQTPSQTATPSVTTTTTPTVTRTQTPTKTQTPTVTTTPTNTATPTQTPYRNIIFENASTGVTLTSFSIGGGSVSVNFSLPLLPGQNGIGQHNGISSLGSFTSTITGLTGNNGWYFEFYKNDVIFSSPYSCQLPETPNSALGSFSITDVLKIRILEAPVSC